MPSTALATSGVWCNVQMAILLGVLLTTLILFLFLHSWRGTLVAAIAMPATIISTFVLLEQFDSKTGAQLSNSSQSESSRWGPPKSQVSVSSRLPVRWSSASASR